MADQVTLPTNDDIATHVINGKHYQAIIPFEDMVALGLVPGWSIMKGLGEREQMLKVVTGEDICRMNELNPSPADVTMMPAPTPSGESLSLYCRDSDDAAGGVGVEEVTIEYIDTSYAPQTKVVATNGGTTTTGITDSVFVNDVYSSGVGAMPGMAVGNIHVFKTGDTSTIYNFIIKGGNKSLVPHRMVPDGHKLLLKGWHVEEAQGKRINFRLRSTDMNGVLLTDVFCFKDINYCNKSQSGWLKLNDTIPARSIVKVSGWGDVGGAEGSCGWWGYLVEV